MGRALPSWFGYFSYGFAESDPRGAVFTMEMAKCWSNGRPFAYGSVF